MSELNFYSTYIPIFTRKRAKNGNSKAQNLLTLQTSITQGRCVVKSFLRCYCLYK